MSNETKTDADAGRLEHGVRPYATSVIWRSSGGCSWQQWHDDEDPMPTEWDDRPPDEVVHVYTAAQVSNMLAAERERCAKLCEDLETRVWRTYKNGGAANQHTEGRSDGAGECAALIRGA